MGFVMDMSDRVTRAEFRPPDLRRAARAVRQDPAVIEAYLGPKVAPAAAGAGGARRVSGARGRRAARRLRPHRRRCSGIDLRVAGGPGRVPDRRQRRGQDHDDARALRPDAAARPGGSASPAREIGGMRPHRIAALGLRQVPEGRQVFAELTVAENLALGAYLVPERRRDRAAAGGGAGALSAPARAAGAVGRVALGRRAADAGDRPGADGRAPPAAAGRAEHGPGAAVRGGDLRHHRRAASAAGTTILLVEQNASAALDVADHAYVLETGRIVLSGPAAAVARDARGGGSVSRRIRGTGELEPTNLRGTTDRAFQRCTVPVSGLGCGSIGA